MTTREVGEDEAKSGQLALAMADVEIEAQAKLSKQYPRSMQKALDNALLELDLDPALAGKAFYAIPYKEWKDGQERTVMVEGPSIKAAMSLAGHWGNCANGARIVAQDDERVIVEGVFIDYERNVRTVRQQVVSRMRYDKKTSRMVPLREDRVVMAIQSGGSKAVRNAILGSIPAAIVERYLSKAKQLAATGGKATKLSTKDLKSRLDKMVAAFAEYGVSQAHLAEYMKVNLAALESNEDKLGHMVGVYNSLKDGMAQASDVFGGEAKPTGGQESRATGATGSVKMDELLKKKDDEPEKPVQTVWAE